jgi:predicted lipoprotein with Yx(FWY)xxD motif
MIGWSKFLSGAALMASCIFALAACGGDDGDGGSGSPTFIDAAQQTRTFATPANVTPLAGVTLAAGTTTILIANSASGPFLTDSQGFALYTTKNDTAGDGQSSCVRSCTQLWPPLIVEGAPTVPEGVVGALGTITRVEDGTSQATYNGLPLYRYIQDTQPGQTNGSNLGGVWDIARP